MQSVTTYPPFPQNMSAVFLFNTLFPVGEHAFSKKTAGSKNRKRCFFVKQKMFGKISNCFSVKQSSIETGGPVLHFYRAYPNREAVVFRIYFLFLLRKMPVVQKSAIKTYQHTCKNLLLTILNVKYYDSKFKLCFVPKR